MEKLFFVTAEIINLKVKFYFIVFYLAFQKLQFAIVKLECIDCFLLVTYLT